MSYRNEFRDFQREYYWTAPRIFMMVVLALVGLGALGFGLRYMGIVSFGIFAPMEEAIRRDVMIESRAYTEATTRRMYELKLQHETATSEDAKNTIRLMVLHETRAFDKTRLPRDLQLFLAQIGG